MLAVRTALLLLSQLLCRQLSNYYTFSINLATMNASILFAFSSLCTTAIYCGLFLQMYVSRFGEKPNVLNVNIYIVPSCDPISAIQHTSRCKSARPLKVSVLTSDIQFHRAEIRWLSIGLEDDHSRRCFFGNKRQIEIYISNMQL